jgi:integrase
MVSPVWRALAMKHQNQRLLKIYFHTFQHWKVTVFYHKTGGSQCVKDFLGHKGLRNTEVYTNI